MMALAVIVLAGCAVTSDGMAPKPNRFWTIREDRVASADLLLMGGPDNRTRVYTDKKGVDHYDTLPPLRSAHCEPKGADLRGILAALQTARPVAVLPADRRGVGWFVTLTMKDGRKIRSVVTYFGEEQMGAGDLAVILHGQPAMLPPEGKTAFFRIAKELGCETRPDPKFPTYD